MRRRAYRLLLIGVCQVAAWQVLSRAQEAPPAIPRAPSAESESDEAQDAPVKEAKPDLYYMPDKEGNLQPVLGFKLEEFQRLLALRDAGAGPQRPGFRLSKLSVAGVAGPEHADLSLQFTIFTSDKNWVRVPLRLGGAALREAAQYDGPSEHFLEYSEAEQGYVAWFRGETDQPLRLTLHVLAPLEKSGGEFRLKLNAPRAVDSELILTVPQAKALGQVSTGAFLQSAKPLANGTEFKVLGLANDFSLSWREAGQMAAGVPTVLQALGKVLVRIDGPSVNTEATLQVSSFGGEFQEFRVRLPRGASLVAGDQTDYTVEPAPEANPPATEPGVVIVRLNAKTAGPATVRLVTEQGRQAAQTDELLDLGGFEIEGAVRQWGHLAVAVSGDWQVAWGERLRVQQVDDLPAELRRDDLVAGFEYYGQPYSLPARVLPRKSVVGVEPQYLVQVGTDRLQLDARLKYRIGGAKVFSLEVDMAGWEVDVTGIGPDSVVNGAGVVAAEGLPLTIPLLQPSSGEVVVALRAFRKIEPDANSLEFELPRPRTDSPAGAALVVLPADNVEIEPRQEDLFGLSQQRLETELLLPPHQQEPWTYRADAAEARFAAGFRVHQRSIQVAVKSKLTLGASGVGSVEQKFAYNIAREAVASLALDVPYLLFESGKIEVSLQDRTMPLSLAGGEEVDAGQPVRMRVDFPDQRIGAFELTIRYPLLEEQPIPRASVPFKAPLVMPGEEDVCISNELTVRTRPGVRVQAVDPRWTSKIPSGDDETEDLTLTATSWRPDVELGLRLEERTAAESTLVERAWLQTWLTESGRLDRAVYRFTSRGRQISVRLPAGVMGVQVLLDGRVTNPRQGRSSEERVVEWQRTGAEAGQHVLEMRYQVADRGSRHSRLLVQLPEVTSAAAVRRTYWQLVLPRDEYLLSGPAGATPEFTWGWKGLYWGRLPLLNEQGLEEWSGLTQHDTGLPQGVNRYLFSGSQMTPTQSISTGSRSLLVLVASGLVLLLGLLWIYVPAIRQPGILFAGGVAALALGLWSPESALLLLQAATAGLALALLAGLLERGVSRRRKRSISRRGATSSIVSRLPPQTPRMSSPPPSTETAAVGMELSAPDAGP